MYVISLQTMAYVVGRLCSYHFNLLVRLLFFHNARKSFVVCWEMIKDALNAESRTAWEQVHNSDRSLLIKYGYVFVTRSFNGIQLIIQQAGSSTPSWQLLHTDTCV